MQSTSALGHSPSLSWYSMWLFVCCCWAGDGTGGESIYGPTFEDEVVAKLGHNSKGVLSMANAGRNTNSSQVLFSPLGCATDRKATVLVFHADRTGGMPQFFLTFKACPHLDGKHSVFGKVTEGVEVLEDLEQVKVDKNNRPTKPVKL